MPRLLRAQAPGKAIITGEHAVVYGAPALAVAVAQYTRVEFKPISQNAVINTLFSGISMGASYPLHAISRFKDKLDARFEEFSAGNLPVQQILSRPDDLVIYTVCTLAQHLPSRGTIKSFLPSSGQLISHSEIPMGAGMGSSAAAIAATMVLYEKLLDKHLSQDQRYEMVRFCERLQHGKGSAIDAATVVFGGAVLLENAQVQKISVDTQNWFWLYTGSPCTSTGECVAQVRRLHGKDSILWAEFSALIGEFAHALAAGNDCATYIKANQQFLERIGVVPAATTQLINAIHQAGGSAKISGAGAVAGDKGGLVLAYMPNGAHALRELIDTYHIHKWGALNIDTQGAIFLSERL